MNALTKSRRRCQCEVDAIEPFPNSPFTSKDGRQFVIWIECNGWERPAGWIVTAARDGDRQRRLPKEEDVLGRAENLDDAIRQATGESPLSLYEK